MDSPYIVIDNGADGNGNAITTLLQAANVQGSGTAAPGGSRPGPGSGGSYRSGFLSRPVTPLEIFLFLVGLLAMVGLIVVIKKHI